MSRVLVDSNVIIDVLAQDPMWRGWSEQKLVELAVNHELCINPFIYAELCPGFRQREQLDTVLDAIPLTKLNLPYEACMPASEAFLRHRARGGTRTSVLPDFFIGAHAQVERLPLLTRDVRRYRTYFPEVELIAPPDEMLEAAAPRN